MLGSTIQCAIAFDDEPTAREAAAELQRERFQVEIQASGPDWVVSAVPPGRIIDVDAVNVRMRGLAASLGGSFLGFGGLTSVPVTRLSPPRANG